MDSIIAIGIPLLSLTISIIGGLVVGLKIYKKRMKPQIQQIKEVSKTRDFKSFLLSNQISCPKQWNIALNIGEIFLAICMVLLVIAPIITFHSPNTVLRSENYSLFQLLGHNHNSLISWLIMLVLTCLVLLAAGYIYVFDYIKSSFLSKATLNKEKSSTGAFVLSAVVLAISSLLSAGLFFFAFSVETEIIVIHVAHNSFSKQGAGWGLWLASILLLVVAVIPFGCTRAFDQIKNAYLLGTMSDDAIIQKLKGGALFVQLQKTKSDPSLTDKLTELNKLKEMGLITEEEYETKKKQLLEK